MTRYFALAALATTVILTGCSGPSQPPADAAAKSEPAAPAVEIPAGATTVALDVKGMHCDACAESITAELQKVDGVYVSQVSFAETHADVTYDPERVTPDAIIATIAAVNKTYVATLAGSADADADATASDTAVAH